jgi:mRNA interferase MazF
VERFGGLTSGSLDLEAPLLGFIVVMSNLALRNALGNVFLPSAESGLEKDSVINVSQLVTIDKEDLLERVGQLPFEKILEVDEGLRRILSL